LIDAHNAKPSKTHHIKIQGSFSNDKHTRHETYMLGTTVVSRSGKIMKNVFERGKHWLQNQLY